MTARLITRCLIVVSLCACAHAFTRPSEVGVRHVRSLNLDWKHYRGSVGGNAYENGYNDDYWDDVNLPHSVDYPEPTQNGEDNAYEGIAWYRRGISVSGSNKKYFLQFEGAMQTTDVWVNGQSAGSHDNSGYTGFEFDITDEMGSSTSAALAVQLDNRMDNDIPPGRTNPGPDYFLYSGLYRDVWLVTTNEVYIPFCGQEIRTPSISASSGTAQFRTTVRNESGSSEDCTVDISIRNKSGQEVATGTATESVPNNDSREITISIDVSNPGLWSPETPEFYRTYTTVSTGGNVVDDYAATFGFRTLSWSEVNGFSLNGERYHVEGACEHQTFAWIGNAVPDTRWPVEINQIKDAGFNSIRLSHYPRDPSFYYAADSLGVLLYVEPPTWGFGKQTYSSAYWTRLNECARQMVAQAFNHPSVFLWGLFNEPGGFFSDRLGTMNDIVHSLDDTRHTIIAQNVNMGTSGNADIVGLNYATINSFGDPGTSEPKYITTEYFEGWNYYCTRGSGSESGWSDEGWAAYERANDQGLAHAGQYLWVYNDYWAPYNPDKPMGIVDQYRLPKMLYYKFREEFTGVAPDYAVSGSATKIDLTADLDHLLSNGADITIVQAAFRNNSDECINSTSNITFSISGPATSFGPMTKPAQGGKIAIVVRSTRVNGDITITANSGGLPQAQVVIPSTDAPVPARKPIPAASSSAGNRIGIRARGNMVTVSSSDRRADRILAVDIHGRVVSSWRDASSANIGGRNLARGVYVVKAEKDGMAAIRKLPNCTD